MSDHPEKCLLFKIVVSTYNGVPEKWCAIRNQGAHNICWRKYARSYYRHFLGSKNKIINWFLKNAFGQKARSKIMLNSTGHIFKNFKTSVSKAGSEWLQFQQNVSSRFFDYLLGREPVIKVKKVNLILTIWWL